MTRKRVAYLITAAVLLAGGLACGQGGPVDQQCKAGRTRTVRTGHGIVHQQCVQKPTDVTPQWHKVP